MMKKRRFGLLLAAAATAALMGACSEGDAESTGKGDDVVDIVWYPNESGNDLKSARDAIGDAVGEATGKEVKHHLTTDYAIAIETIVNNNAELAFMGAQGYIEAKEGNDAIEPLAVPTGPSGTLDDAKYHSWIAVEKENADEYKNGDNYTIDPIEGKSFSFVSNSSTSGFVVPSSSILNHFSDKGLSEEDLMEGGPFFEQVQFGGSHQGSAVNLLKGTVEAAAFCDTCVDNYVEVAEGEANMPGSVYRVKDGAAEPFHTVPGEEFVLVSVTPVLNAPFVANTEVLSEEDFNKIRDVFTSEEIADNEEIFVPEDSEASGLFKKTEGERFVEVEDSWFDPIRELSN